MIFKKQSFVKSYPAYVVVKREADSHGAVNLTYGEQLILKTDNPRTNHLRTYSIGSVVGYALSYNDDPIAAYEHAVKNKHALHWINANPSVLSDSQHDAVLMIEVEIGMEVQFEGHRFTIAAAPNGNLQLIRLTK